MVWGAAFQPGCSNGDKLLLLGGYLIDSVIMQLDYLVYIYMTLYDFIRRYIWWLFRGHGVSIQPCFLRVIFDVLSFVKRCMLLCLVTMGIPCLGDPQQKARRDEVDVLPSGKIDGCTHPKGSIDGSCDDIGTFMSLRYFLSILNPKFQLWWIARGFWSTTSIKDTSTPRLCLSRACCHFDKSHIDTTPRWIPWLVLKCILADGLMDEIHGVGEPIVGSLFFFTFFCIYRFFAGDFGKN